MTVFKGAPNRNGAGRVKMWPAEGLHDLVQLTKQSFVLARCSGSTPMM